MRHNVLITGGAESYGALLSAQLSAQPEVGQVFLVDDHTPDEPIGSAIFMRADIRSPLIARIIDENRITQVVHVGVQTSRDAVGTRLVQKDINIMGTMHVLAAAQASKTVQRIVVKSSSAVYSSSSGDPAVFSEHMTARRLPAEASGRDLLDIESYVRRLARRRSDISVCMLRMADLVGEGVRNTFTDFFKGRMVGVPFGYNPRFQVLHVQDAIGALMQAVLGEAQGTINVAGPGLLTMHQASRFAGCVEIPLIPGVSGVLYPLTRRIGVATLDPDQEAFLSWGRVMSLARMHDDLQFTPRFNTRQAFIDAFGSAQQRAQVRESMRVAPQRPRQRLRDPHLEHERSPAVWGHAALVAQNQERPIS